MPIGGRFGPHSSDAKWVAGERYARRVRSTVIRIAWPT